MTGRGAAKRGAQARHSTQPCYDCGTALEVRIPVAYVSSR